MNEEQEIQISIDQARAAIERGEAIKRLYATPDFKAVIVEGYFTDEAVRLTHLLGSPNMQEAAQQKAIVDDLRAIAALSSHLRHALMHADRAKQAVEENESELERIRQEDSEEFGVSTDQLAEAH